MKNIKLTKKERFEMVVIVTSFTGMLTHMLIGFLVLKSIIYYIGNAMNDITYKGLLLISIIYLFIRYVIDMVATIDYEIKQVSMNTTLRVYIIESLMISFLSIKIIQDLFSGQIDNLVFMIMIAIFIYIEFNRLLVDVYNKWNTDNPEKNIVLDQYSNYLTLSTKKKLINKKD